MRLEVGLFQAVSQTKITGQDGGEVERESSSTLDKSRSSLNPEEVSWASSIRGTGRYREFSMFRCEGVKEPFFPQSFGAGPSVVRRQGNREKVA